ncbi:MAG: rhomboid family intramembrane serine protease [Chitinophagaceae bacterium]|nr:rhomboid family intramembrane serine protease [Chitinophagaceae bacterium]
MPYTERQYRQRISLGQSGNNLVMLIAICLIVFVGFAFMKAVWYFRFSDAKDQVPALFSKNVLGLFTLPADTGSLFHKPWVIITHMFVHDNVWKVFANMLWLWTFGYILQDLTGNRKLIPLFIYGSLGGAIAFILAYNMLPSLAPLKAQAVVAGASAGVMAIAVATTLMSPGYRIFPLIAGGIPLWVLTAIYVLSDLATVSISDTGILINHLAGAVTGFLFIYFMKMGYDWSEWMSNFFDWITNLFNPDKPRKNRTIKEELFYKSSSAPYKRTMNVTPQRVDEILDKINQQGYSSLTPEEKELLQRASKEDL